MSYEVIHRSEMVTCSPLGQNVLSTEKKRQNDENCDI